MARIDPEKIMAEPNDGSAIVINQQSVLRVVSLRGDVKSHPSCRRN